MRMASYRRTYKFIVVLMFASGALLADSVAMAQEQSAANGTAIALPDSPGTLYSQNLIQDQGTQGQQSQTQSQPTPTPSQQDQQQQNQQSGTQQSQSSGPQQAPSAQEPGAPRVPAGTAAARAASPTGVAASEPAGYAIAPAKQRRVRTILISMGAVLGAGAALGAVAALSSGSPSRPPGAH